MSVSDPQWNVVRCAGCGELMKVPKEVGAGGIACPHCGAMAGDDEEAVEVIVSDSEEIDLPGELGKLEDLPEISIPNSMDPTAENIPQPRRDEYKMPEMISNLGGQQRTPERDVVSVPKIDASKLGSTSDERLAPEEVEEGAVQQHVARKITGWDIDSEEEADSGGGSLEKLKGRVIVATITLVSVVLVGVVVFGLIRAMKKGEVVEIPVERNEGELARDTLTPAERLALDRPKEGFAAAGEQIGKFLSAPTYQERLPFVRDRERVEPLMRDYYRENPDGAIGYRIPPDGWTMRPFKEFLLGGVAFDDFTTRFIAVEVKEGGELLIDWESFVGYCEVPWSQIAKVKPTEPVLMRAVASIGDYYNYGFTDSEWACIRLAGADGNDVIYAYVRLEGPLLDELKKVMVLRGSSHITLKISHAGEGKEATQFLIRDVLASGWVFSETNIIPLDREGAEEAE